MAWINKGDLISARGKRWVATTESYTKLVREWSGSDEIELATAVGAIKAAPEDGLGTEVELIFSRDTVSLLERAVQL